MSNAMDILNGIDVNGSESTESTTIVKKPGDMENGVDMTVNFVSNAEIRYNDIKKAYDLDIWHGSVNPFLHDAEVC